MELMSSFQNKICYANIKTCAHMLKTYRKKNHSEGFLTIIFLVVEIPLGRRNGLCH